MSVELNVRQTAAGQRLWLAVRDALDQGLTVPCTADPQRWDESAQPADCYACPVLSACVRYRQTGVVSHATVLAGQRVQAERGVA